MLLYVGSASFRNKDAVANNDNLKSFASGQFDLKIKQNKNWEKNQWKIEYRTKKKGKEGLG